MGEEGAGDGVTFAFGGVETFGEEAWEGGGVYVAAVAFRDA